MFTVSGIGVIPKDAEIQEYQPKTGLYINFPMITKDPYKQGRQHIRVSLYVPMDTIEEAREAIQPGRPFLIRIGELAGNKSDAGNIFMTVRTKWSWIEPLKALPGPERRKENL